MMRRSLRLRLIAGSALWIVLALLVAGLALQWLFRDLAERRLEDELVRHLDQLTGRVSSTQDGRLVLSSPLSDPRFDTPFSGLYFVLVDREGRVTRSRSLWDSEISLPDEPAPEAGVASYALTADGAGPVRVVERTVRFFDVEGNARLAIAGSIGPIVEDVATFTRFLVTSLAILAFLLIAAAWLTTSIGLLPLDRLGRAVARIRKRQAERLATDVPAEVAPLVEELNGLLADNRAMVERAQKDAADLAHGLKTPLTILGHEAEALSQADQPDLGLRLQAQVQRMQRRIDQRLAAARAHARARTGQEVAVAPVVAGLVQVLRPLAERRSLTLHQDVPAELVFGGAREDLEEILGNLLENAVKWAASSIAVTGAIRAGRLLLTVADDGPGLSDEDTARALVRGARLDEITPGDGLGLSIVGELAAVYGGRIELGRAAGGGLAATVLLPGRTA
ncbi:sensor histidine kinase [Geminicoccus roseus]|uniref:sensor histidine kinase n=1 Tax=Geminicoccus roseus TaxID=404900 RepID=UPI000429B2DE|nr:HAMP domain-containing sensor histidine kinase [Geminicoccus roseus]